jgi:cyclopropane fatty-acyl-phospholipid synthase-like methyltransferase
MSREIDQQSRFWDKEIASFDAIYSEGKGALNNLLDRVFRWDMRARFDYTMRESEPISGRSFLDVGCGTGRYSLEYVRRGARRVVGIDVSANMVDTCRQRASEEKAEDRTLFVLTDLLDYETEETFDVTIGIGLFDYIRDSFPVIRAMRERTTDRAIMTFPRLYTWRAPVRRARLFVKGSDVYFYTRGELDDLLLRAGFRRYTLEVVGQLYCVTAWV